MQIRVGNITPYARTGVVRTTVSLPDGFLHPAVDGEDALRVTGATDNAFDWAQWWPQASPQAMAAGELGWRYASGCCRKIAVAFPCKIGAGAAIGSPGRIPGMDGYQLYTDKIVTLSKTTTTPVAWAENPLVASQLRATRFILDNGLGDTAICELNPDVDEEVFDWRASGNANMRYFVTRARLGVADPVTRADLLLEIWYEVPRNIDGPSHAIKCKYAVCASDPRQPLLWYRVPQRLTLRIETAATPVAPYEEWQMPEWIPSTYNAQGDTRLTNGSGVAPIGNAIGSRIIESGAHTFVLWDPTDRVGSGGFVDILQTNRDKLGEGQSLIGPIVLNFFTASPSAHAIDTMLATISPEHQYELLALDQDWLGNVQNFGPTGVIPDRDWRHEFASDDEAFAAGMTAALDELFYQRGWWSDGRTDWPIRDPIGRPHMGMHPDQPSGGDVPSFGTNKGYREPMTGAIETRHIETNVYANFAICGHNLREADGRLFDPESYAHPSTRDILQEQAVPCYIGRPGWASATFSTRTLNGLTFQASNWGKGFGPSFVPPVSPNSVAARGINSDVGGTFTGGLGGNAWSGDTGITGGLEGGHGDIHWIAAYVELTSDAHTLYMMDQVMKPTLAMPIVMDSEEHEYWLPEQFNGGTGQFTPEQWSDGSPWTTHGRWIGRPMEVLAHCYRLTGRERCRTKLVNYLINAKRWACGSDYREFNFYDRSRYPQGVFPAFDETFRREFCPLEGVTSLWCWTHGGYFVQQTEQQAQSEGGTRETLTYLRNYQAGVTGDPSRDFTNFTGANRPAWMGTVNPGNGYKFFRKFDSAAHSLPVSFARYLTRLPVIGSPIYFDGTAASGGYMDQTGTSGPNATGDFYIACALIITQTAGKFALWGSPSDSTNQVYWDRTARKLWMGCSATPVQISNNMPIAGPVQIEIVRISSAVTVYVNGVVVNTAGTALIPTTWNGKGWGYGHGTVSHCDEIVLEHLQCNGSTTEDQRRKLQEYFRAKRHLWVREFASDADREVDYGSWRLVPYGLPLDQRQVDQLLVSQPTTSIFQIALMATAFRIARRLIEDDANAQPGSRYEEARDFAAEWQRKASRYIKRHGFSTNVEGAHFYFGVPARTSIFGIGIYSRYLSEAEMTHIGPPPVEGVFQALQVPDSLNPGKFIVLPAASWDFCKEWIPPVHEGIVDWADDKEWLADAIQLETETLATLLGQFPLGHARNRYGFGVEGYSKSQTESWLAVSHVGVFGPIADTPISATITASGDIDFGEIELHKHISSTMVGTGGIRLVSITVGVAPRFVDEFITLTAGGDLQAVFANVLPEALVGGQGDIKLESLDVLGSMFTDLLGDPIKGLGDFLFTALVDPLLTLDPMTGAGDIMFACEVTVPQTHDLDDFIIDGAGEIDSDSIHCVGFVDIEFTISGSGDVFATLPGTIAVPLDPAGFDFIFRPLAQQLIQLFGQGFSATFDTIVAVYDPVSNSVPDTPRNTFTVRCSPLVQNVESPDLTGATSAALYIAAADVEDTTPFEGDTPLVPRAGTRVRFSGDSSDWIVAGVTRYQASSLMAAYEVQVVK